MNLYVSNLTYTLTDEELLNEFAAYGTVTHARVVKDRETGRSRGFGFVALVLASVNIFGGFLVTQRMLAMYKKKG